jgi:hypothetical protein
LVNRNCELWVICADQVMRFCHTPAAITMQLISLIFLAPRARIIRPSARHADPALPH